MVPSDWDLAPKSVCGPNFISYLIGESPILSAGSNPSILAPAVYVLKIWRQNICTN